MSPEAFPRGIFADLPGNERREKMGKEKNGNCKREGGGKGGKF